MLTHDLIKDKPRKLAEFNSETYGNEKLGSP
jgi:hypothetical protein